MGVTIAAVGPEQVRAFLATTEMAFGYDIDGDERVERFASLFEPDRSRAAFDGDTIVGTLGTFSLEMTVPGGVLPCGGTTIVSVLPTHRRRGILRSMMDAHLQDVRDRKEPIVALWAADSAIYGRFGYGCAAQATEVEISRQHNRFHRLAPDPSPVRIVDPEEAGRLLPPLYDSVRRDIPGFFARSETWWKNRRLHDDPSSRQDSSGLRYAIVDSGGDGRGYVQYRFKEDWSSGHGEGELTVRELIGTDPASLAGLWTFILNHDLTGKIVASLRSVEDPIFELLEGPRRATRKVSDSLWVRVMDPKTALEGRSYSGRAATVIELRDPLDLTASRWRLDLSPQGAEVLPTTDAAQVTMDLEDLGACYMGWSRFGALGRAGRVVGDPDHLVGLDRAFAWSPLPWCPEVF
jgi:predicted acetyltransferase